MILTKHIFFVSFFTAQAMQASIEKSRSSSLYLSSNKTSIYGEAENGIYNARYVSNNTPPIYNSDVQIHSTLQFSSRRASIPSKFLPTFSNLTKESIDLSSLKASSTSTTNSSTIVASVNASGRYLSVDPPTPSFSSSSKTNSYLHNQNIPVTSHHPLCNHILWNSNLFYSQSRSVNEVLSTYPTTIRNIFDQKIDNVGLPITSKDTDVVSASICSDVNSDCDSLDIIIDDKESSPIISRKITQTDTFSSSQSNMKRNPYSIEELLKKPEKKLRRLNSFSLQQSIIASNDNLSDSLPMTNNTIANTQACLIQNNINSTKQTNSNRITIEVCDIGV